MGKPKIRFKGYNDSGNSGSWGIFFDRVSAVDVEAGFNREMVHDYFVRKFIL